MKKLFFTLSTILILFSCSSSDDSSDSNEPNQDQTKYIKIYNEYYYFDSAFISRIDNTSNFEVALYNSTTTDYLTININYQRDNDNPPNYYYDLRNATYLYSTNQFFSIYTVSYHKHNSTTNTYSILFNNSDFIGVPITINRVVVNKNTDSNYTFDYSFVTSQGNITGSYTGEFTKTGF